MHISMVLSKQNSLIISSKPEYDLDKVKGKIQTTTKVVILPFDTVIVKGQAKLNILPKCINVLIEPTLGYLQHIAAV